MINSRHYDYGAYKFLSFAWFPAVLLIVEGSAAVVALVLRRPGRFAQAVGVSIIFVGQVTLLWVRLGRFETRTPGETMAHYSQVRAVTGMTDGPVLLAVNEPLAYAWALFYLRYIPVVPVTFPHDYIAGTEHLAPFAEKRARHSSCRYLLSDSSTDLTCAGSITWQGGPYRLWRLNDKAWAFVVGIQNPNGLETMNSENFMWIGGASPTRLRILSGMHGRAHLHAKIALGPSLPQSIPRTLETASSEELVVETVDARGRNELIIPVVPGLTETTLRVLETPTGSLPNGDPRPLLVAMSAYKTCLSVPR